MKYLKQFVVGSSFFVFFPYFLAVKLNKKDRNYSYQDYTFVAPIWLGLWNVISLILAENFGLSMRMRFLLVSILSSISVMMVSTFLKTYKFTKYEWYKYYVKILR